jgi:hypothetical protein
MGGSNEGKPARGSLEDEISRDNSQWTTDQDGAICKLRKDGMSWAGIGECIGRKKSHVQHRFSFIKSQIEAAGFDTDSIGENWAEDMRQQGKEVPSPGKASPLKQSRHEHVVKEIPSKQPSRPNLPSPIQQCSDPESCLSMPPISRQPSPPGCQWSSPRSPGMADFRVPDYGQEEELNTAERSVRARGGGGKKHNDKPAVNFTSTGSPRTGSVKLSGRFIEKDGVRFAELAEPAKSSSSSSSGGGGDTDDDAGDEEDIDHDTEREEQKRFMYHEYWSEMYPAQKMYKSDKFWSEDDCKVLAVIEAKDKALKYKRIQAEFFNATGRMISDEVIKFKMQQGR